MSESESLPDGAQVGRGTCVARARVCVSAQTRAPLTVRLDPLATLVSESDPRRRVLGNIDRIAQGAVDTVRTYTNKRGEHVVVAQPDWHAVLRAMVAGAALLDHEFAKATKALDGENPILRRIMMAAGGVSAREGNGP